MAKITNLTTQPSPPVAGESTNITVGMEDPTKFKSMKVYISFPRYANNELNGGVWGGGNGFAEINCNDFTILDELVNVPTNVTITEPVNGAYLLVNTPYTFSGTAANATNYDWNYGDGSDVIIGQTTEHTYTSIGAATVVFTAMNENGYSYTTHNVSIGTLPIIDITSPTSSIKYRNEDEISFTIDVENYVNIKWNFGDGTILDHATDNVTHVYTNPGTYIASVIVTNNYGEVSDTVVVNVYERPTNLRILSPESTGLYYARIPISFVGSASGAISYEWDFGDNMTYIGLTAQHTYAGAGTYTVKFTAYTDHVSDTIETVITVLAQ